MFKTILKIIKESNDSLLIIKENDDEFVKKLESVFTRFLICFYKVFLGNS